MALTRSERLEKISRDLVEGVDFPEYCDEVHAYFTGERPPEEIEEYRAKKRSLKVLRDEVVPTMKFLNFRSFIGRVRFPHNSSEVDCIATSTSGEIPIEVTIAMSKAQAIAGARLNLEKMGTGMPCLLDSAPPAAFKAWSESTRISRSVEHILKTVPLGVKEALERKVKNTYPPNTVLLIEVPLFRIETGRWLGRFDNLKEMACSTQFDEIHLVGTNEVGGEFCDQLK